MTLDCVRLSFKYDNTYKYLPEKSTYKWQDQRDYKSSFQYSFKPQKSKTALSIFEGFTFYYMPNSVNFSVDSDMSSRKEGRFTINDTTDVGYWDITHPVNNDKLRLKASTSYEIFTNFSYGYDLNSSRDRGLEQKYEGQKKLGLETDRSEKNSLEYKFNYLSNYFTPSAKAAVAYSQKQLFSEQENEQDTTSEETYSNRFNYNMERSLSGSLSLKADNLLTAFFDWPFRLAQSKPQTTPEIADSTQAEAEKKEEAPAKDPFSTSALWKKITKISGTYSLSQKTAYENQSLIPDWNYRFGLNLEADTTAWQSMVEKRAYGSSVGFKPLSQLQLDGSYSYAYTESWSKSVVKKTEKVVFPDVSVKVTGIDALFLERIGLTSVMNDVEVSSAFKQEETVNANEDLSMPLTVVRSNSYSPLARVTWKLFKSVTCNASFSMNDSETENTGSGGGTAYTKFGQSKTLSGGMKYSFSAPRGIRLPFMKSRIHFESKLTTSLDFDYKYQEEFTRKDNVDELNVRKTIFSLKPKASYQFSNNVTGGLDAEYSTEQDDKMKRNMNTIQFNLWVTLKF